VQNPYKRGECIGQGAEANVYKATEIATNKTVAYMEFHAMPQFNKRLRM